MGSGLQGLGKGFATMGVWAPLGKQTEEDIRDEGLRAHPKP